MANIYLGNLVKGIKTNERKNTSLSSCIIDIKSLFIEDINSINELFLLMLSYFTQIAWNHNRTSLGSKNIFSPPSSHTAQYYWSRKRKKNGDEYECWKQQRNIPQII